MPLPVPTLEMPPPRVGLALWEEPQREPRGHGQRGCRHTFFNMSVRKLYVQVSHGPFLGKGGRVQGKAISLPQASLLGRKAVLVSLWINSAPPPLWIEVP